MWKCTHPPCTENILQRVVSTLKLFWAFVLALLDDLTDGLNSFCKDNLDISKVLRFERALLNQQQKKVKEMILYFIFSLYIARRSPVLKCPPELTVCTRLTLKIYVIVSCFCTDSVQTNKQTNTVCVLFFRAKR